MADIEQHRREFEREAMPHMSAMYNFAMRLTRNPDDAADLVQDSMLKGFRFFDSFDKGTNCKAWLFRILKNTHINRYRQESKAPETVEYDVVEEFYDTIKDSSVETSTLERKIFDETLDDELSTALDNLPEMFRTVVVMCDIEELTYEEIAELLDCPIGTVRSRLHRARKILAATLSGYAKERGFEVGDRNPGKKCEPPGGKVSS